MTAGRQAAAIDLVIFDCDGVLIDSEVISARMLIAELAGHGVAIDMPYVARHFLGRSYPVVLQNVRDSFGIDLPYSFEVDYRARLLAAFEADLRVMPGIARWS
jgi:beta-phosphoglucomutase-like phosphatase (HAD superfamily)